MSDIPLRIPSDCPLQPDKTKPRFDAEAAATIIHCLLGREDAPLQLELQSTSGIKGQRGEEWVEASILRGTGFYHLAFYVRGGFITNLFLARTPKGAEYCILDGGDPFFDITIEERKKLTAMLIKTDPADAVKIVPCWIITVNDARPYAAHLFYSEEEAEEAAVEQRAHFAKYSKLSQSTEKDEEKKVAKERATVAFNKKTKKKK